MKALIGFFKNIFSRSVYVVIATDNEGKVKEICVIKDFKESWKLYEIFREEYGSIHTCFASRGINQVPENWKSQPHSK